MKTKKQISIRLLLSVAVLCGLCGCRQQAYVQPTPLKQGYHTETGMLNPTYILNKWATSTYEEKHLLDQRIDEYYTQVTHTENPAQLYYDLGKTLYVRCRLEEMQEAFKEALNHDSANPENYYFLACAYYFTKKYDVAKKYFVKSKQFGMRIDPQTVDFFRKTTPQVVGLYRARLNFNIEKPYVKKGLKSASFEDLLQLENDEIDLATFGLIASQYVSEKLYGKTFDRALYQEKINDIVDDILAEIGAEKRPGWIVNALNRKLFFEYKFRVPAEDTANPLYESYNLMNYLLDYKKGVCMTLSLLYLSVAQRMALPVYGVVAPGHFFVRYDDQIHRINVETTNLGRALKNDYYRKEYPNLDTEETLYFKNLTIKETVGCYLNNLGTLFINKQHYDDGIKLLRLANEFTPHFSEPFINLGKAYLDMKQYDAAIEAFSDGLAFNKRHSQLLKGLGIVYFLTNKYDQSLEELKIASAITSKDPHIHYYIGKIYQIRDRHSDAILEFRDALTLEPASAELHFQIAQSYYAVNKYDFAWKHVNEMRKQGVRVDPEFLSILKNASPEPHIAD